MFVLRISEPSKECKPHISMTSSYKRNHGLSRRICSPSSIKVHRWNLHPAKLMPGFVNPNQLVIDSTPSHTLGLRTPTWEAISWKGNRQYTVLKTKSNIWDTNWSSWFSNHPTSGNRHLNHIQIWLVDYEDEWLTMANCSPAKLPKNPSRPLKHSCHDACILMFTNLMLNEANE